jgi:predicted Zn-dependent protease
VIARVAVAALAVAVLAWLGLMERNAALEARGVAAAGRLTTPGNGARAEDSLRAARVLNPDTAPDVSRAILYRAQGRTAAAVALLDDVLRREPDNLRAWGLLYAVAAGGDPEAVRRALAARRRLDPLGAAR